MPTIRKTAQINKISGKVATNQGCFSEQYPWFSFRSMTKNSRYDLSSLKNKTEREQTIDGLYRKLIELSGNTWLHWTQCPKQSGLETISYADLKFDPAPGCNLTKDTSLYVFRFDTYQGAGKGRIIGYKNSPCAVLHIIGYDLDFTAYNHG